MRKQIAEQLREVSVIVVANKSDLECEIAEMASKVNIKVNWRNGYVEVSAKDDVNIARIFSQLISQSNRPTELADLKRATLLTSTDQLPRKYCCLML